MPLAKVIVVKDDPKAIPSFVPPAHDGFDSEDDSLQQSYYHLLPKAALKGIESLDTTEVLRFRLERHDLRARAAQRRHRRRQVPEPHPRQARDSSSSSSSGSSSGRRASNSAGAYLGLDDFYVGARVEMAGRTFIIFEMDECSANYMEAHLPKFPRSDKLVVLRKIRSQLNKSEFLARVAKCKQSQQTRHEVDVEELTALFDGMVADFAHHDAITIIRNYGKKDAMKMELEILLQLLV